MPKQTVEKDRHERKSAGRKMPPAPSKPPPKHLKMRKNIANTKTVSHSNEGQNFHRQRQQTLDSPRIIENSILNESASVALEIDWDGLQKSLDTYADSQLKTCRNTPCITTSKVVSQITPMCVPLSLTSSCPFVEVNRLLCTSEYLKSHLFFVCFRSVSSPGRRLRGLTLTCFPCRTMSFPR